MQPSFHFAFYKILKPLEANLRSTLNVFTEFNCINKPFFAIPCNDIIACFFPLNKITQHFLFSCFINQNVKIEISEFAIKYMYILVDSPPASAASRGVLEVIRSP